MWLKIMLSKQEISINVLLKDGGGGGHDTGTPWELGRGSRGYQGTMWVGWDHCGVYPSLQLSAGKRLSGMVGGGAEGICDSKEAPTLIANHIGQHLWSLWKQVQGSGLIPPAGLTSGPPLKSSSKVPWGD